MDRCLRSVRRAFSARDRRSSAREASKLDLFQGAGIARLRAFFKPSRPNRKDKTRRDEKQRTPGGNSFENLGSGSPEKRGRFTSE